MKKQKIECFLVAGLLAFAGAAQGANFFKADNSTALNLPASWVNNAVPGAADIAVWDSTVSGANTVNALGTNTTWGGIQILNPGGAVQISADGSTLTNGAAGIDLSQATQDLTLSNNVALSAPQTWSVASGRTLTFGGGIFKNVGGAVSFELPDISANVVVTNPVNTLLTNGATLYGTVNDTDYAAINGSGQIVGGSTLGIYTPNPTASAKPTTAVLDFTATSVAGFTLSGNSVLDGVRFNQPNVFAPSWTINTGGHTLSINTFLVTTNVGNQPIFVNGGGPVRIFNTGTDELLVFQNNPSASLIFQSGAQITQQGGSAVLTKLGAGTVEIQSASAYTGGTRIYDGEILISGGGTVGAGAANVFGGKFSGATGAANVAPTAVFSNAAVNVDVNSADGQFLQKTNLSFASGSRLQFTLADGLNFSSVNAPLVVTNAGAVIFATNAVSIDILGNLSAGQFPLVKYATLDGDGFAAFQLGNLQPHVSAFLSNDVANSSIDLVVVANNDPLKWAAGSGVWDIDTTANWRDATGAAATYQQSGIFADSVLFEDSASGTSPIAVTLETDVTPLSVAFDSTKNYAISGAGGIGGATALTKAGSGVLTLTTTNHFSGGLNLNGGVVHFSSLANLGDGVINFSGGTLQYNNGDSDDISARTVNFNSGGATIDDGGNTISFANPVGSGGAGGLTKIGSGTLTLNGTNTYSGGTVVGAGTLALGGASSISDSAFIAIGSGATLDVSASSPIPLQNQILAGDGTVNGGVFVGDGATISPATNGVVGALTVNNGDLTVDGGTLTIDVSSTASDLIVVNGNLNLTSGSLQLNALDALPVGTYKFIQYSGALSGSAANLALNGFSQPGKTASLSDANANEIDLVISSAGGANLVWQGDGGNNFWDIGVSPDWTNSSGAEVTFANADSVTFDSTSPNQTVNLRAAVQPSSVTVNGPANYTFEDGSGTGAGKISGATGLAKNGSGTLTLLTANNNSGATTINAGTIQVGNGGATGDIGTGNITDNGALVFAQPDSRNVAGQISGGGGLTQQGSSTLTLAANNSYSGATTISSGTLQVGNGGNTGTLGSAPVVDNGALVINRAGTYSLNNGISGAGTLAFIGAGTTVLSGANSYQGATTVSNGVVKLGASEVIPDAATTPGATSGLVIGSSAATLDLNGFNETVNSLSGAGVVTNSASAGTSQLTAGDDNSTVFTGLILENPSGGKIALSKQGSGSLELDSANKYSGGTFVGDGTLTLHSAAASTGSGSLVLSNGTTLNLTSSGNSRPAVANGIVVADNSTASISADNLAVAINGTISGGADATNLIVSAISFGAANLQQFQNFAGAVQIPAGGSIRFSATTGLNNGGSNTVFDLEGGSLFVRNNGTVSLGALTGNASGSIVTPSVSGTGVYLIGGKGVDSTFPGVITGQNSLVKVGAGTLTLNGATNVTTTLNGDGSTSTNFSLGNLLSYTGTTTISNGTLALVAPAAITNSPVITLASASAVLDVSDDGFVNGESLLTNSLLEVVPGQTLTGVGTIRGHVLADAGSIVNAGLPTGVLTVTGNAELAGTVNAVLNRTNSPNGSELAAQSILIDSTATLIVTNAGDALQGGEVFQLFNQPVSGFASVTLPDISAPLSWTNKLAIDGTIAVLGSIVNTNATSIGSVVSGNTLTLSWPADHIGWHLQAQTNAFGAGLGTNWVDLPETATTNLISIPVNPTNGSVFFRLTFP